METISINSTALPAEKIEFSGINIMMIKVPKGALGCAYINLNAAEKFSHALAIVSGVATYEDMLNAEVKAVSSAASALGVSVGMSGKEALIKML